MYEGREEAAALLLGKMVEKKLLDVKQDENGKSFLMQVIQSGWKKAAVEMVKQGADPLAEDHAKNTPLSLAHEKQIKGLVEAMVQARGPQLMYRMVLDRRLDLVEALVEAKADPNGETSNELTIQEIAMLHKRNDSLAFLVKQTEVKIGGNTAEEI